MSKGAKKKHLGLVKIKQDRGYGNGMWIIRDDAVSEYHLEKRGHDGEGTGDLLTIYRAHTYKDADCVRYNVLDQHKVQEKNSKIGVKA